MLAGTGATMLALASGTSQAGPMAARKPRQMPRRSHNPEMQHALSGWRGGAPLASACSFTSACTAPSAGRSGYWKRRAYPLPNIEYVAHATTFRPRVGAPRTRARFAKQAGMRYMVLTAKYHEGF